MTIARDIVGRPAMRPDVEREMNPGLVVRHDADWLAFARRDGQTIYHPVGTCSMGRDPDAVVDERLCVRGLNSLHVLDPPVMPTELSGNTRAAVLMIAEKGADLTRDATRG